MDSRRNVRLLIADDDPGFRETVVEIVSPYFETVAVESAEQALEIVESEIIDLALFDMHMQILSGLDAIRWMRRHRLDLPCILMSSDVTDEMRTQAQALRTFSVLRKPPRRDQLLDTIQGALEL
ncbi:response regulator [Planctomicrobium sp. SH664]|uniref:response regulator n=1 Tax=Planctomicrobium sp. SH664 TaxID=3448125 RepID=UPI003F5C214F